MWRQREVELGPGATGYCITRSRWPRERRGLLQPSPTPQARRPRVQGGRVKLRVSCSREHSYPMGRLKEARGGEGVLGAQFSIAGEGGDVLPDRLMGGTRHLLCSPGLSSAPARGFFPPVSLLPALCPDVCGKERCWEMEGEGKASFLSRSRAEQSPLRGTPSVALCSLGLRGHKAPRIAPALS